MKNFEIQHGERITSQMSLSRLEEIYNVRPGFRPIQTFTKAARIVGILIKAGGCFGTKKRMTVGQDEAVCYDTPESRNIEGMSSYQDISTLCFVHLYHIIWFISCGP